MTALELITIWYRSKKIDLGLFHLLQRNILRAPFTRYGLNIHNISAERFIELIKSGEIAGIYGMGEKRMEVLKNILKPQHEILYRVFGPHAHAHKPGDSQPDVPLVQKRAGE